MVSKYISLPPTVVISGIRRCGQSTLLHQIIAKFYGKGGYYFNFEDESFIRLILSLISSIWELAMYNKSSF